MLVLMERVLIFLLRFCEGWNFWFNNFCSFGWGWVEISKMERIKGRGIDIGSKMVLAFNTKRLAKLSVKSILVAVAKVMYLAI